MKSTLLWLATASLLAACASPAEDYEVSGQLVHGPAQGADLIRNEANSKIAADAAALPGLDKPARVIHSVAPRITDEMRRHDVWGDVRARLFVGANGKVIAVVIVESPDPLLSRAVSDAMRQWRFAPPVEKGKATPFRAEQVYTFRPD